MRLRNLALTVLFGLGVCGFVSAEESGNWFTRMFSRSSEKSEPAKDEPAKAAPKSTAPDEPHRESASRSGASSGRLRTPHEVGDRVRR